MTRMSVGVAVAAALGMLGVAGASASGAATNTLQTASLRLARSSHTPAGPGAQLWVRRYNGPSDKGDSARSVAVSPNGRTVFVTGDSYGRASGADYATVAYRVTNGTRLWVSRYSSPGNQGDQANSVAVSRNGHTVFVTGYSQVSHRHYDDVTIAYNATNGSQLWIRRYGGPANSDNFAYSAAVSPNGRTVVVTGATDIYGGAGPRWDYTTIAYNAATGAQLWVKRYNGPGNGTDQASSVAVSCNAVFVTGHSEGVTSGEDYATVAYSPATGAQLWVSRYNGPGNGDDEAASVATSHGAVFVTGRSAASAGENDADYATVAYSAATGARLWIARYNGPGNLYDAAASLAVGQRGGAVFVTGVSDGATSNEDYATVAYSTATGARLWIARYNGPGNGYDAATSITASHGGRKVFVTGTSAGPIGTSPDDTDYATVAYSTATGAQLWVSRYNGPGNGDDEALSVAASRSGRTVFVTGYSNRYSAGSSGWNYATLAYRG